MALLQDPTGAGTLVTVAPAGTGRGCHRRGPVDPFELRPAACGPPPPAARPGAVSQGTTVTSEIARQRQRRCRQPELHLEEIAPHLSRQRRRMVEHAPGLRRPGPVERGPEPLRPAAGAQVYVIQRNTDLSATVRFGDGVNGARLTTGTGNVVATYRYGSGSGEPTRRAPDDDRSSSRPNLAAIHNPLAVSGGNDPQSPADVKTNAPASVFAFGRAISAVDYEVVASAGGRRHPGEGLLDLRRRQPAHPRQDLRQRRCGRRGAPRPWPWPGQRTRTGPSAVTAARPIEVSLSCTLVVAADRRGQTTSSPRPRPRAPIRAPGPFSPPQMGIGQRLYRSHVEAALSVPGVIAVHELTVTWTVSAPPPLILTFRAARPGCRSRRGRVLRPPAGQSHDLGGPEQWLTSSTATPATTPSGCGSCCPMSTARMTPMPTAPRGRCGSC